MDVTGKKVLDLGCGSGVLGIYAAQKGASEVIGYDNDPLAVENSLENFAINEVASVCRAHLGTIDDIPSGCTFDITIVNIIRKVIVPIVGRLKAMTAPGGTIILAGLLTQDAEAIEAALNKHGLSEFTIRPDNEWLTYSIRV
jgi:ribosomal protein L11 methyltransferase